MARSRNTTKKAQPVITPAGSVVSSSGVKVTTFRGKDGRFTKRPKPEPGLESIGQAGVDKKGGIVAQMTGRRTLYRDPVTGKFAKRPKAPQTVVIGKGKRARELRPTTNAKRVKALRYDEAEALSQSASTASRMVEDNAIQGRRTFVKASGAFYEIPEDNAGAMAQLVRLLNAEYIKAFVGLVPSPWLQYGTIELSDADVLDLDGANLLPPGMDDLLEGDEDAANVAEEFLDRQNELLRQYLKPKRTPPSEKATKDKPTAKGRRSAPSKDNKARKGRRN